MPKTDLGGRPPGLDGDEAESEILAFEAALRGRPRAADESGTLGQADRLARDLADIERAAAALRRAQPRLKDWKPRAGDRPAGATRKPRPVWLLIALLWFSTALVTAGAVAAIARLAG